VSAEVSAGLSVPHAVRSPMSMVDQAVSNGVAGLQVPGLLDGQDDTLYDVFVTPTPAAATPSVRRSPRMRRKHRTHPICPIQAKWDRPHPRQALDTRKVTMGAISRVAIHRRRRRQGATRIDYYQLVARKRRTKISSIGHASQSALLHASEEREVLMLQQVERHRQQQ